MVVHVQKGEELRGEVAVEVEVPQPFEGALTTMPQLPLQPPQHSPLVLVSEEAVVARQ